MSRRRSYSGGGGDHIGWILALVGIGIAVYVYLIPGVSASLESNTTAAKKYLTTVPTGISNLLTKTLPAAAAKITATSAAKITATSQDYVIQTQDALQVLLPNGYVATAIDAGPDTPVDYFPAGNTVNFSTLAGLNASDVYAAVVQDTTGSSQGNNPNAYWNAGTELADQARITAGLAPNQQGHWLNPATPGTWYYTQQVWG
jgi:hypothetical protein